MEDLEDLKEALNRHAEKEVMTIDGRTGKPRRSPFSRPRRCFYFCQVKPRVVFGLLIFSLSVFCPALARESRGSLKVSVDCVGGDDVGRRLCYAVKERIRASRAFRLTAEIEIRGFGLHIVSESSEDSSATNLLSAIAATITVKLPRMPNYETYLDSIVMLVGANKVSVEADYLVARLDHDADGFRTFSD